MKEMTQNEKSTISRRAFIGTSIAGIAGLTLLPSFKAINLLETKTVRLGFIGLGQQAMYLMNGFIGIEGVQVVAGCDVYGIKRERFEQRVKTFNESKGVKSEVKMFEKYQDLLALSNVDAVVIAVPDHWHALIAIAACKAGKDVYLEKPMTFTIKEGQTLIKAVRSNKRVFGLGSQQRSDKIFQHAVNLVQSGAIGKISKVNAHVGAPPKPYDLPEEQLPADLNWDLWLGPNPFLHYNKELNPPISLNPPQDEQFWGGWRWYKEIGGGFTTDWGAHMFDIAQWGLGMDKSGPVEIIPAGYGDAKFLTFKYANGVIMTEETFKDYMKGVKFWGDKGWIEVSRGFFDASDKKLIPKVENSGERYETQVPHLQNFIDAIRTRKDPQVPVEIGHRSCSVCNLGNIAYELKRPVKWDPKKEAFVKDAEAEKFMHRQYREGYSL